MINVNMELSAEKSEEEHEKECTQVSQMFPDAKFVVALELCELEEVISELPEIIIKNTYTCYCYSKHDKKTEYFHISGENLTNAFVVNQLIKQGLNLECDHCFLEGFHKTKNSDCQFEILTGS